MAVKKPHRVTSCRRCGGPIPATKRSHAMYCSDLCGTLYRNKSWQAANPDKMKAAIKRWQAEHRGLLNERVAGRARAIRAAQRAARPSRFCKHCGALVTSKYSHTSFCSRVCQSRWNSIAWAKQNPGKARARSRRHEQALRRAIPRSLSAEDHAQIAAIYQRSIDISACTGIPHQVDHIVPLQGVEVSGLHVPWNLSVIPAVDNRRKGNRLASEATSHAESRVSDGL